MKPEKNVVSFSVVRPKNTSEITFNTVEEHHEKEYEKGEIAIFECSIIL